MIDTNNYKPEKTNTHISFYPQKQLIVADIVHIAFKEVQLTIVDMDNEVIYDDCIKHIECTSEGYASSICSKPVKFIDATHDGRLLVQVDMTEESPINIIKHNTLYKNYDFLYPIVLDKANGGTLSVDYDPSEDIKFSDYAIAGKKMRVIATPNPGYVIDNESVNITGLHNSSIKIDSYIEYQYKHHSVYEFIMPNASIEIYIGFIKEDKNDQS